MAELAQWINTHLDTLIATASAELAPAESMRETVEESIAAFYEALSLSARIATSVPLHAIFIDWTESRSAPSENDMSSYMPLLGILKRLIWREICRICEPETALRLLGEADNLLTEAGNFLAKLEAETLLNASQRALTKAQTHVQRLDKNKSDFIAVAAHELKTPLTLIEGYTNMLKAEIDEKEQPRMTLMVNGISSGTLRLKEIIDDMIDVALIDMRMLTLHFQPIYIHSLIHMVEFELSDAIRKRRITLAIRPEELKEKLTYGDPERLHQVFQKVISNAVKYTPDGGSVTVSARELPGFTDVMITDTGIGIASENLIRIFDKFSSMTDIALHSSGKMKYKGGGPGLGLAIAKGIMEAHGGSIWAESAGYDEKKLHGSTFHIMIPMRNQAPDEMPNTGVTLMAEPEVESTDA